LAELSPDLITGPNYSLFLKVPRWDNMHSIKRIAISWCELVSEGVPASLHLNARTDRDWERWTNFVVKRDEVKSVAFEFTTGPACVRRGGWHVEKLATLASAAGRDLQLVVRGGSRHLPTLVRAFSEVVFVDSSPFMKTVHRRRLAWQPGAKEEWYWDERMKHTPVLDELLQYNVDTFISMIQHKTESSVLYK
jgi:hypothetical protein